MIGFNLAFRSIRRGLAHPAAALVLGTAMLSFATTTNAGSIFDDDYTPPKRSEPSAPQPTPTPTPTPDASPEKRVPGTPSAHPSEVPAPTPTDSPVAHRAVPDRASRAKSRRLFEEVYAAELKDHTPVGAPEVGGNAIG